MILPASSRELVLALACVTLSGCSPECGEDPLDLGWSVLAEVIDTGTPAELRGIHSPPAGETHVVVGSDGTVLVWDHLTGSLESYPVPGAPDLWGVHGSMQEAWIVGDGGFLARSYDGGASWQALDTGSTADLRAVWTSPADDSLMVVAVGTGTVLVRTPNGVLLEPVAPSGDWGSLEDVYCWGRDDSIGCLAVGLEGVVWATDDPSGSWSPVSKGTTESLHAVSDVVLADGQAHTLVGGEHGTLMELHGDGSWTSVEGVVESTETIEHLGEYGVLTDAGRLVLGDGEVLDWAAGARATSTGDWLAVVGADGYLAYRVFTQPYPCD
jgi:photosystem II stability/assembly factor-like uncharacterized protein